MKRRSTDRLTGLGLTSLKDHRQREDMIEELEY